MSDCAINSLALGAPDMWGQVYLEARLRGWPGDAATDAANQAIADCGSDRCESQDELDSVTNEYLRLT
ncbi:hypothetical protein [Burkholderia gladioli]|uniref:hypothetical protein n=1 Tax=Burkholderia gladioli TaxID=28095 RepID=UPI001640DE37|nr:hypothetical protein [Burkholderia gladioli]